MESLVFVVCLVLVSRVSEVLSSAGNVWTYRGSLGPDHWHLDFPHCGGVKQSPISLITNDVIIDTERLTPIVFSGFDVVSSKNYTVENNGHTVQVDLNAKTSEIRGGGLPGTFVAEQFHFHWGATDERGSEHDVNGKHFPMEMHLVHYNKRYENISVAMDKEDGLAVLGFFFEIGRFNPHFEEIINHFNQIKYKNNEVEISSIPLVQLMPAKLSKFYRYEGSLTTPPCYESVVWTLFNETIEIAEEQLMDFRTTIFENDEDDSFSSRDISDDFRPVQCMFRRRVYASHSSLKYSNHNEAIVRDNGNTGSLSRPLSFTAISILALFISLFLVC
ncbi:carbonic anhydrase 12-like [Ruditapes philippinarum]|uniref:carbonic anhydrase 12-like n=1 Tax=Ruditapes philippinarum TaxID=129788 RepID=UPI00295B5113|nr:carbonic anhydrase 12-like [Ruditapes philippinarum]